MSTWIPARERTKRRCVSMSNRHAFLLWVSVSIKGAHNFRLFIPIPLFLLLGFADFLEDASMLVPFVLKKSHVKKVSPAEAKQIAAVCVELIRELALRAEPIDLVDVDVHDVMNHVKVKCLLR